MSYAFEGELTGTKTERDKARHIIASLRGNVQIGYATKRQLDRLWTIYEPIFGADWKRFISWLTFHMLDDLPKTWAHKLIVWSQRKAFQGEIDCVRDFFHYTQDD